MDSSKRSIIKTITWRIVGSAATFFVGYLITGDVSIAGSIFIIQFFLNMLLYFIHERLWTHIKWGVK